MLDPTYAVSVWCPRLACIAQPRKQGKYKVRKEKKYFCDGVPKTIMARNLSHQYQTQTQLPVRISTLKGTEYTRYVDHKGVQSCDCDCNPIVNPDSHVENGFLYF